MFFLSKLSTSMLLNLYPMYYASNSLVPRPFPPMQGEIWYTLFVHVCNIPSANSVYLAPPPKEMPRDEASHTYDVVVIDRLVTLLQEPGRIWPGKKMPGRMGGKRVTVPSLKVLL